MLNTLITAASLSNCNVVKCNESFTADIPLSTEHYLLTEPENQIDSGNPLKAIHVKKKILLSYCLHFTKHGLKTKEYMVLKYKDILK